MNILDSNFIFCITYNNIEHNGINNFTSSNYLLDQVKYNYYSIILYYILDYILDYILKKYFGKNIQKSKICLNKKAFI